MDFADALHVASSSKQTVLGFDYSIKIITLSYQYVKRYVKIGNLLIYKYILFSLNSRSPVPDQALTLLFLSGLETEPLLERLTALFLTNPCCERKHRNPPRKKTSDRGLLDFHKRRKKHHF